MAGGIKITNLTEAKSIAKEDIIVVVQDSVTKKSKVANLELLFDRSAQSTNNEINKLKTKVSSLEVATKDVERKANDVSNSLTANYATKSSVDTLDSKIRELEDEIGSGTGGDYSDQIGYLSNRINALDNNINNDINPRINQINGDLSAISADAANISGFISSVNNNLSGISENEEKITSLMNDFIDLMETFKDIQAALYDVSLISTVLSGGDLLSAIQSLQNRIKRIDNLSVALTGLSANLKEEAEQNSLKIASAIDEVHEISNDVIELATSVYRSDNNGCVNPSKRDFYSNKPIDCFFNAICLNIGNIANEEDAIALIDNNTFRNNEREYDINEARLSNIGSNFFDLNGVALRQSEFSSIVDSESSTRSLALSATLSIDSDVAIYSNNRQFFSVIDDCSAQSKMHCYINGKKAPFYHCVEDSANECQDDFKLKFSGRLEAGSTILLSVGNEDVSYEINGVETKDFYNAVDNNIIDLDEGRYNLLGMVVATPTKKAEEEISEALFEKFKLQLSAVEKTNIANNVKYSISVYLANDKADKLNFLNSVEFPINELSCCCYYGGGYTTLSAISSDSDGYISLSSLDNSPIVVRDVLSCETTEGGDVCLSSVALSGKFKDYNRIISLASISLEELNKGHSL